MSREIVSRVAYLIGVKNVCLPQFDDIILKKLKESSDCSLVRKLCQLRTHLLTNYYEIERDLKRNQGKISAIDNCKGLYDSLINKHGLDIELYSTNIKEYITKVNKEIEERIDLITPLFPTTMKNEVWVYIRNLFIYPSGNLTEERKKFISEREYYPFSCYINWTPQKAGNILDNDDKLMTILFSINGKTYEVPKEEMVKNIYSFADKCKRVILAVDCENVEYAAFYVALIQFKSELINKIEKVVLFDDSDLKSGWNFYNCDLPIEFERIDCPRIQNNKSTLDVKMSAYITAAHYRDGIDGIILASSDSDYWGLIDTISSSAKFFVLGEKTKISSRNIKALDDSKIPYCMLDDFNNHIVREKIIDRTYRNEIKVLLSRTKFNIDFFLNILQNQTMYLPENDKNTFRQIACNLKISFDENGNTKFEI